jgi:hypothetical protein
MGSILGATFMWNIIRRSIAISCFLVTACSPQDEPTSTIEDLLFQKRAEEALFDWELPAALGRYPATIPILRKRAEQDAATCIEAAPCKESVRYTVKFDGETLLDLERSSFRTGGAHNNWDTEDWLFDKRTGRPIRFGTIFRSWDEARPILQRKWCSALAEWRRENSHDTGGRCPPVGRMTLLLVNGSEGSLMAEREPANQIQVTIDPYDTAGFASAESGDLTIDIDEEIRDLVSERYRSDISTYDGS